MALTDYSAGRKTFLLERANIAAMVEREPRTVRHPAAYPSTTHVPVAQVIANAVHGAGL